MKIGNLKYPQKTNKTKNKKNRKIGYREDSSIATTKKSSIQASSPDSLIIIVD